MENPFFSKRSKRLKLLFLTMNISACISLIASSDIESLLSSFVGLSSGLIWLWMYGRSHAILNLDISEMEAKSELLNSEMLNALSVKKEQLEDQMLDELEEFKQAQLSEITRETKQIQRSRLDSLNTEVENVRDELRKECDRKRALLENREVELENELLAMDANKKAEKHRLTVIANKQEAIFNQKLAELDESWKELELEKAKVIKTKESNLAQLMAAKNQAEMALEENKKEAIRAYNEKIDQMKVENQELKSEISALTWQLSQKEPDYPRGLEPDVVAAREIMKILFCEYDIFSHFLGSLLSMDEIQIKLSMVGTTKSKLNRMKDDLRNTLNLVKSPEIESDVGGYRFIITPKYLNPGTYSDSDNSVSELYIPTQELLADFKLPTTPFRVSTLINKQITQKEVNWIWCLRNRLNPPLTQVNPTLKIVWNANPGDNKTYIIAKYRYSAIMDFLSC
ncbi:hypothetical protein [Moorena sp. SIO3B2]|uniref:hypothetical protein n=1 Tax=Moorena sp. SIO3B2 TaxID=2607827 RepID=UPI0013C95D9D|nr:hypothetical protein [Moorena sp. SIO3B2]NEP33769.1 hypothetical protein [Moorena sp. SIO3B2]